MAEIVKILSQEVSVNSTPSSISGATLVRLVNTSTSANALITRRDSSNNVISSCTLPFAGGDGSVMFMMKDSTDTLESNSATTVGAAAGFY